MKHIKQVVLASTNPGKIREFERLLGPEPGFELIVIPTFKAPQEDRPTYAGNAELKAAAAAKQFGLLALGEDSGIEVMELNGMPGPLTARFAGLSQKLRDQLIQNPSPALIREAAVCGMMGSSPSDEEANKLLLQLLRDRLQPEDVGPGVFLSEARYVAHIALSDPDGRIFFRAEHTAHGFIANEERGTEGFGQDPIMRFFSHDAYTVAELTPADKDRVSHRGKAVREVLGYLQQNW